MEIITIAGRVGQDAKVNDTNGVKKTMFSIAVDKSYKDQQGNRVERTNWWTVFTNSEKLAQYVKKGQFLTIVGTPSFSVYRNTTTGHESVNLVINSKEIGWGPKPDVGHAPEPNHDAPQSNVGNMNTPKSDPQFDEEEDRLPF
jgi:single-strand DNA-binding protein